MQVTELDLSGVQQALELEELIVSKNHLTAFPDHLHSSMPKLTKLNLAR
jgi:hypothetical protein